MYESPRASARMSSPCSNTFSVSRSDKMARASLRICAARVRSVMARGAGTGARNNCVSHRRQSELPATNTLFSKDTKGKRIAGIWRFEGGHGWNNHPVSLWHTIHKLEKASDQNHDQGEGEIDVHPERSVGLKLFRRFAAAGEKAGEQENRQSEEELDAHDHVVTALHAKYRLVFITGREAQVCDATDQ